MIENPLRTSNFTSSEIVKLTKEGKKEGTFGVPALTYIAECRMERRLGRSVETETNAKPLSWGSLLEPRAFELLGLEYSLFSTDTIQHPSIPYWAGSPDGGKPETTAEIKCPFTLKSFCQLVDPLYDGYEGMAAMEKIREASEWGEKYYWQTVSNAILMGNKYGELIIYMPYLSELPDIRSLAMGQPEYYWIWAATDKELPYLLDGGFYKNMNIVRFEIPQEDIDYLTDTVIRAGVLLNEDRPMIAPKIEQTKIELLKII